MNTADIFREYVGAYNAKDVHRMLAFFADDCVFENISAGKVTVRTRGKAELETLAIRSAEIFASREQKILSLIESRERLAAEIEYHAVLRLDLSPELRAGSKLELRGVSICDFVNGKIARLTDYS